MVSLKRLFKGGRNSAAVTATGGSQTRTTPSFASWNSSVSSAGSDVTLLAARIRRRLRRQQKEEGSFVDSSSYGPRLGGDLSEGLWDLLVPLPWREDCLSSDLRVSLINCWMVDSYFRHTDFKQEMIIKAHNANHAVLSVSHSGGVTWRQQDEALPCGCKGGSLWRFRFERTGQVTGPLALPSSSSSSYFCVGLTPSIVPPIPPLTRAVLGGVDYCVMQYLGEETPCTESSAGCVKHLIGSFLSAGTALSGSSPARRRLLRPHRTPPTAPLVLQDPTSSFFSPSASLLSYYVQDLERMEAMFFHAPSGAHIGTCNKKKPQWILSDEVVADQSHSLMLTLIDNVTDAAAEFNQPS